MTKKGLWESFASNVKKRSKTFRVRINLECCVTKLSNKIFQFHGKKEKDRKSIIREYNPCKVTEVTNVGIEYFSLPTKLFYYITQQKRQKILPHFDIVCGAAKACKEKSPNTSAADA
ncbi:CLUMA_CG015622, isoform A [Clunio marinus]|uniref:CLUMA_CG015622, isoform A n=1 Tax=Clunio marinus TaxID=568069 RepID=A0A1J1ISD4_9DIPT|nr:CLUMA_CG015622, isoform A [Clunio marinus]